MTMSSGNFKEIVKPDYKRGGRMPKKKVKKVASGMHKMPNGMMMSDKEMAEMMKKQKMMPLEQQTYMKRQANKKSHYKK